MGGKIKDWAQGGYGEQLVWTTRAWLDGGNEALPSFFTFAYDVFLGFVIRHRKNRSGPKM